VNFAVFSHAVIDVILPLNNYIVDSSAGSKIGFLCMGGDSVESRKAAEKRAAQERQQG